ncbi:MAG TPA: phosphatase PAP2 family protein [Vicinamibacterales bacterium]|nr:phosphatase PAP2 family protein [Vicinamibacterales bacterium]
MLPGHGPLPARSRRRPHPGVSLALLLLLLWPAPGRADTRPANAGDPAVAQAAKSAPARAGTGGPPPLFPTLAKDFEHFVSPETGFWLAGGLGVALGAHQEDRQTTTAFTGDVTLDHAFAPGGVLGNGWTELGTAAGVYALGLASHHAAAARLGSALLRAGVVAGLVTDALKIAVRRTRPNGANYSFPSGHTSVTFASATVLARAYGWKVGLPAFLAATYVGASRIESRHHYLSDVVFGAAIGIAGGRTIELTAGRHRLAVGAAAVPGGLAIVFEPRLR